MTKAPTAIAMNLDELEERAVCRVIRNGGSQRSGIDFCRCPAGGCAFSADRQPRLDVDCLAWFLSAWLRLGLGHIASGEA
jgi:hypothetical protein